MGEPVPMSRSRDTRSFGPTILAGLSGGALTAVAGTRDWARATGDAAGIKVDAAVTGSQSSPLVAALALVALATWGVLLVIRGRPRRAVAGVGMLASVGALIAVLAGFSVVQDEAVSALMGQAASQQTRTSSLTAWYYAAGTGALVTTGAFLIAVGRSPSWPSMGTKYDAPAAQAQAPATEEDMWRALDRGNDPTS